jgi:hypothetical protein
MSRRKTKRYEDYESDYAFGGLGTDNIGVFTGRKYRRKRKRK